MNTPTTQSHDTIAVSFTGQLVLSRDALEELLRSLVVTASSQAQAENFEKVDGHTELPRLAYSLRETAEILGVSYITVFRLIQRGLIRCSQALRTKLIPRKEIERFLRETAAK